MLIHNNVIELNSVENRIYRYAALKREIEIREAEVKKLKQQLIEEHFLTNKEYVDAHGLQLMTYSVTEPERFDVTRFKAERPEIYCAYKVKGIVETLRPVYKNLER